MRLEIRPMKLITKRRKKLRGQNDMKKKKSPLVSVVMGSASDLPIMKETTSILDEFDIPYEIYLTSAHRSPERTRSYSKDLEKKGIKVIIAGAGAAAHLAGVIASNTMLPVIGVPIDSTSLHGLDSLLSTVQMPGGIPVATMAIGPAGAKNGALFAIRMLALDDTTLHKKLQSYTKRMAKAIEEAQEKL